MTETISRAHRDHRLAWRDRSDERGAGGRATSVMADLQNIRAKIATREQFFFFEMLRVADEQECAAAVGNFQNE